MGLQALRIGCCRRARVGLQDRPAEERLTLADGEGEGARGVVLAISREIVDDVLQEHPACAMPCICRYLAYATHAYARILATLSGHAWEAIGHKGGGAGWGGAAHALPTLVPAAAPPQLSSAKWTCVIGVDADAVMI